MQTMIASINTMDGEPVAESVEIVIDDPYMAPRLGTAVWTGLFASTAAPDIDAGPYLLTLNDVRSCRIEINRVAPFYDTYIIGLGELSASGETT